MAISTKTLPVSSQAQLRTRSAAPARSGSPEAAAKTPATTSPTGVASSKPAFLPISTSRCCQSVQPEEARGGDEGERDQEQPRVAPPPRRDADRVAERDVDRSRREHQPEVRRVVLPALVDRRVREHQHEHGSADDEHEQRPEGVRGAAA
jgi:hypothetical protein